MCGRFVAGRAVRDVADVFHTQGPLPNLPARWNLAPSQDVLAVVFDAATRMRRLDVFRWGLIPAWAKDPQIGYSLINARAETCDSKPAFREAFRARRCIIPADAFYEWNAMGKRKQPYTILRCDRAPLAFAGLWEQWLDRTSGEIVESCTIITTTANELCAPLHDRMPVILDEADWARWLGEEPADAATLKALLKPCPADVLETWPVDPRVGNVRSEGAELMERAPLEQPQLF